ncbi:hypothetical protein K439DRAFT_762331 [Ramaria rubella]|nr:hypothetical protein K439DRAFT_762331 [Ramaria rubella]
MHIIVLTRYVYFFFSFFLHVALATVGGIAVRGTLPLVGAPVALFAGLFGTLALVGLLTFDINRTVSGFGFFCFVCKIWFELVLMTLLFILDLSSLFIVFTQNKRFCLAPPADAASQARRLDPCQILQLIWAFQILVAIIVFLYIVFLGAVSIKHYVETPKVFTAAVRDFPWGIPNASSKPVKDLNRPIQFPVQTLPTFEEAYGPTMPKTYEEGQLHADRLHAFFAQAY